MSLHGFDSLWSAAAVFLAGLGAGAANAVAGGGTNLSFPVLLWMGVPAVAANATNAVALWPGGAAATWEFRREIRGAGVGWYWLTVPSLLGGAAGAVLLIHSPSSIFRTIAPGLVLGSSLLVALEPVVRSRLGTAAGRRSPRWLLGAGTVQLAISVYGGYFGAGIGMMILSALALLGLPDLHQANGLKNLYSLLIKGVAVVYFAVTGSVVWGVAAVMAAGALVGGVIGARLGRAVGPRPLRWIVVGIGLLMGGIMAVRHL